MIRENTYRIRKNFNLLCQRMNFALERGILIGVQFDEVGRWSIQLNVGTWWSEHCCSESVEKKSSIAQNAYLLCDARLFNLEKYVFHTLRASLIAEISSNFTRSGFVRGNQRIIQLKIAVPRCNNLKWNIDNEPILWWFKWTMCAKSPQQFSHTRIDWLTTEPKWIDLKSRWLSIATRKADFMFVYQCFHVWWPSQPKNERLAHGKCPVWFRKFSHRIMLPAWPKIPDTWWCCRRPFWHISAGWVAAMEQKSIPPIDFLSNWAYNFWPVQSKRWTMEPSENEFHDFRSLSMLQTNQTYTHNQRWSITGVEHRI